MKKILFLLLATVSIYGQTYQNPTYGKLKLKTNTESTTAEKVNVQETDGTLNWQFISDFQNNKPYFSTGLLKNGLLTINADNTKFDLSAGIGVYSDFSDPENVTSKVFNFPAFNAVSSPYLATSNITYVAVNYNGGSPVLVMQASKFSNTQLRDLVVVGAVVHSNFTTINTINNISSPSNDVGNSVADLFNFLGAKNQEGNVYSANGANLQLNKSAGVMFKYGANFHLNAKNPHNVSLPEQLSLTFRYRLQGGFEGTDRINVDVDNYDLNNVLTAVPPNKYTIQTIFIPQTGQTRIQYGQTTYGTIEEARAAINTRKFNVETNLATQFVKVAYLVVKKGTTSLQVVADADIIQASKFDATASGGVAITYQSIIDALGYVPDNLANKQNSLAVDESGVKYPTVDAVNKTEYAKNYSSIPFLSKYNDDLQNSSILILGDSNYDTPDRMTLPFLKSLIKEKKSRGIGYFSLNVNSENMGLNTHTYSGTWVSKDIFNNGKGLDGRSITSDVLTSEITITPNISISTDLAKTDNVRVFYLKGVACDLEYSVNAGSYVTVTLSTTPSNGLGAFDIPIPLSSVWNLKIRLKTGSVELLGAVASNDTDRGILLNKSAHWGAASSHYLALSTQPSWLSMLSMVNPEVLIIGLSTNEFNNGVPLATTKANFTSLISNIKGTLKSTAIYISIPPKSDDVIVPPTAVTAKMNSEMLINLAKDLKVGYIPIYDFWNKFENIYTDALYVDGVHYNATGAGINANILKKGIGLTSTDISDSFYIGTTDIKNDRASASQTLTGVSIDGNSASTTLWGGRTASFGTLGTTLDYIFAADASVGGAGRSFDSNQLKTWMGLGSNAYNSTAYLPLTGGTLTGKLSSTVSIADYAHSIINSSSSGYGLFIRSGNDLTPSLRINNATDSVNAINLYGNGDATFAGTITASPATVDTELATLGQAKAVAGTSGRYLPTYANIINTSLSAMTSHVYGRVGNMVTVYGSCQLNLTTSGITSSFEISLPINRLTSATVSMGFGNISGSEAVSVPVQVLSNTISTAKISVTASMTGVRVFDYSFSYLTTD